MFVDLPARRTPGGVKVEDRHLVCDEVRFERGQIAAVAHDHCNWIGVLRRGGWIIVDISVLEIEHVNSLNQRQRGRTAVAPVDNRGMRIVSVEIFKLDMQSREGLITP